MADRRWIAKEAEGMDRHHKATLIQEEGHRHKIMATATKMMDMMRLCHLDAVDLAPRREA